MVESGKYMLAEPNVDLILYRGTITLSQESGSLTADGIIELRWLPDARIQFVLTEFPARSLSTLADWVDQQPMLSIAGAVNPVPVLVTNLQMSTATDSRLEGVLNGNLEVRCPEKLAKVECYLPNFANYQFTGPGDSLFLQTLEWEVQIQAVEGVRRLIDAVQKTGGYVLTHRAMISRRDGSTFTASESELLRNGLFRFLSFVQGRKVNVILPIGYTADGQAAWQEWRSWVMDPWRSVLSWSDKHDTSYLCEAYSGFMGLWADEAWRDVLGTVIHWYVEANRNVSGLDAGIIFTQMALELLAWHYFVEHKNAMTKDGFNRLTAADRIRLLLTQHDVPLDIAATLPSLTRWAREFNQADAADVITVVRNILVHPETKLRERFRNAADNPKRDAWTCGLWMLETVLLRLFRYSGRYIDRRTPGRRLMGVPWSKLWDEL